MKIKTFNTEGPCVPSENYMVDITDKLLKIKGMIDEGKYFTINRARQYGKTTTIAALSNYITKEYTVLSLDFQGIGNDGYSNESKFVQEFCRLIVRERMSGLQISDVLYSNFSSLIQDKEANYGKLFDIILEWCNNSDKKIVLFIDEVDTASNNQVFLDFLAQLRTAYLARNTKGTPAFQSVILAGVTDVKHLKSKIRDGDQTKVNSPWNIAADFDVDMSLSQQGIANMIKEYASDHEVSIDAEHLSEIIINYTSGYPYLVSRICYLLDQKVCDIFANNISETWTSQGIDEAIKIILSEKSTLFESLTGKLTNNEKLRDVLYAILMRGESFTYNPDQEEISQMHMYGFVKNDHNKLTISNRIFETRLYNLFLSDEELKSNTFFKEATLAKNMFVSDGILDVSLILEKFISTYNQVMGPLDEKFKEKDGRELFLLYLKPIINGTGNYYIEAQTRNQTRTDVIIDYLGKQYIIELKIWRGNAYNTEGERQIYDYLEYFNLEVGYMLSFNFNKNKKQGVNRIRVKDKVIFEAML